MTRFSAPPQKAILGTSTNNAYLLGLSGIDALDEQVLREILHHSRGGMTYTVQNNIMLKWCTGRSSRIRVLGAPSPIQDGDLKILGSCS
jgi:hypothetical protein